MTDQRHREEDLAASIAALPPAAPDFDGFFRQHHVRLVALATAICGRGRGEDVAQEAMVRAYREWPKVSRYEQPDAWVRRVAVNLAISARRRSGSERRALGRLGARPQLDVAPPEVDDVWALVRALPPMKAAAIALHYLDDLPVAQIAETLGCAEGTARAHLHQGRQALAAQLGEQAGAEDEEDLGHG